MAGNNSGNIRWSRRVLALIISATLAAAPLAACGSWNYGKGSLGYADAAPADVEAESGAIASDWYAVDDWYDDQGLIQPFNTEEYAAVDEGSFTLVATRPLSTVSADVDTASWCNLRRMAREGHGLDDVPAGAVRIEEMLNYFAYDYPAPAEGERFSLIARLGPCPWNDQTELLTLGFATAPEDVASSRGRNLVFLIDVSGSMDAPDKLPLLQESFATLLDQLGPDDLVSIVTYASGEQVVLDGVPAGEGRTILRALNRLQASGSTNGERGLELAYQVAARHFVEGGVNRIVMASDGDLNVGMTSESDLHDYVAARRETGIYLSVLGFCSGNYKDTKMETLADDGNGSYHYIDCAAEAERVFGERLCANLVPFADDVKLQVEFNPAQVKAYRLIGYENRALADEDFRDDTADAGDVGPGAQFTVAYEVVRAGSALDVGAAELKYQDAQPTGSGEWLTATLRHRAFDDGQVHEQALVVGEGDWEADPGADWRRQAAVIELGMLLRGSEHAGTSSMEDVRALVGAEPDAEWEGFLDVAERLSW